MKRLCTAEIDQLPETVHRSNYDRNSVKAGILHLGIGAFHRAHQALYTEDVLNMEQGGDWAIIGASLRNGDVRDQLFPQDNLYTILERDNCSEKIRLVSVIKDVLVGPENPGRLIEAIADSAIKIVSLTVTEKGYCLDPATGELLREHPDILHDLKNPDNPKTIFGYLRAALEIRRQHKQALTIMSCDNLPDNSEMLKNALLSFAAFSNNPDNNSGMISWIKDFCSFPCTMVDRMVPATTAADRLEHKKNINMLDQGVIVCESFRQWVIEDNFVNGRPNWQKAGAIMVDNVNDYEEIKLRLLNGAHSAIAYLGFLAGYDYIYTAIQNKTIARYIKKLMDEEITPSLTVPDNVNVEDYKTTILDRFSNSAVKYKTSQVATDGSQKIPQRWLNTLQYQLKSSGKHDLLYLAIASWIKYLQGVDENGISYNHNDPCRPEFSRIMSAKNLTSHKIVFDIISIQAIFGDNLCQNKTLIDRITYWLEQLNESGALKTMERAVRE